MLKGKEKILFATVILLTGMAGYFVGRLTAPERIQIQQMETAAVCEDMSEKREGGHILINPLIECDNYQPTQKNSVVEMERQVQNFLVKAKEEQKISFVSVYYRDLNFGDWMGINEKENFSPASLLKVPIMITAYKKAETEPSFLQKRIPYTAHLDNNAVPNITDSNMIKIGKYYTIEDLIERMIEHSDNEAKELLLQNLNGNFIIRVMKDIGINTMGNMNGDFVSVKDYSGFFRLLYNGTYLNHDMSEKALALLSKVTYNKGLLAGLPKGITVAHKFGERAYADSNLKQLHECGIVYINNSPYLICVMTRGTDFEVLASVISDISAIVYKEATSTN